MPGTSPIARFLQTRRRAFLALDAVRREVDAWLDTHEQGDLTLMDLAQLEGFNGEREQIAAELQAAESILMAGLRKRAGEDSLSA
jgi:hypothetical protein